MLERPLLAVAIDGLAAMVRVMVAVSLVFAVEVAVIVAVCAELVAAGAVKVAEVAEVFDSVPAPLTLQVTPTLFLSFVTVAVRVMESAPSTFIADAVTATLMGLEPPPQPTKKKKDARIPDQSNKDLFCDMTPPCYNVSNHML